MRDAWLGRLFVRFRDRRDGRALAAVFDATARELLTVAAHLVPTLDLAEDVVQTTFQRAIEQAGRFDEARSLKGWLYGILWREARKLARSELRVPDARALAAEPTVEPGQGVSEQEFTLAVRTALDRLGSPYREVLEGVLVEERPTREVARTLARSPGTVRVQLARGLERLRSELTRGRRRAAVRPQHLAGLAGLRLRLLAEAGLAPGSVPGPSALFLARELVKVGALTPVALVGAAVLASVVLTPPLVRAPEPASALATAEPDGALTGLAGASSGEFLPPARELAGSTTTAARTPVSRSALATGTSPPELTGQVVDAAGVAVGGVRVIAEGEGHYGYRETRTDEHGRFAFPDLVPGRTWYASVDEPRFARMYWRGVGAEIAREDELAADVRLVVHPPHEVRGRIVDEAGDGVEGARLTLAREWLPGAERTQQGHLTETLLTAESGLEGRFALTRLNPGRMTVVLDHPEFARTLVDFGVPSDELEFVLQHGMTLEGVVLLAEEPLAGATVRVRSTRRSSLTMGDHELVTDERGCFRLAHVSPVGALRLQRISTLVLEVQHGGYASDHYQVYESARPDLPFVRVEAWPATERAPALVEVGRDFEGEARLAGRPLGTAAVEVRLAASAAGRPARLALHGTTVTLGEFTSVERVAFDVVRFELLPAGRYRLDADEGTARRWKTLEFELADGERSALTLEPEPRIEGH